MATSEPRNSVQAWETQQGGSWETETGVMGQVRAPMGTLYFTYSLFPLK